jgi:hypothetical protein
LIKIPKFVPNWFDNEDEDIQMYDGFPSLWIICSLVHCNWGTKCDRVCICGIHKGWKWNEISGSYDVEI